MQATTIVHNPSNTHINFAAVAEKLNIIGSNTYVQWGTMLGVVSLVVWFITFKVTTENAVSRLYEDNSALRTELKEMKASLPSKDWLELKFQNLQDQMIVAKNSRK